MARRLRAEAVHTKESKKAEQLARLLTEDFSLDLERVGYYLVRNLPTIVYHRFDVLALTAQEEYDKLMVEIKGK
jgi:RNase adaptor protein for sRNA GlmZ degradation